MVGTRPRSMSAGAKWRNAMQSNADVRQRAASRHRHLPRRCSVKGTPENSRENQAGTQHKSSRVKERAPRAARYATNASIAKRESNEDLKRNHEDVETVKASTVVTSDALADSALKKSEELLREFAALDLANDIICQLPEEEDIYQLPEEQDSHVQSSEELGPEFASRGRVETVEVPMELFDMLVESWKKNHSTLASIEDGEAKNDDSIKVRRSPSPVSRISSGSTTLDDTDSEVGSVTDSVESSASCFRPPRGECVSPCILGGTQSSTASENADGVKILSSPVRMMRSGISTPWIGHSAPQPSQPPTNVFRVQSSSVHMPTRVFTPNTVATSKIASQVKCTTFRQTISITNTVHIYTAC